jgi:hypothetical protein
MRKYACALVFLAALVLGLSTGDVTAGTIILGNSGWSATWSSSRDPVLSMNVDFETSDAIFVEKQLSVQPGDINPAGFFDPVVIIFQQISSNPKRYIVINDEQVVNLSGVDWTGFTMTLLGGAAKFDPVLTGLNTPDGFSIDPFTTGVFSAGDTVLQVSGGTVPSSPAPNNTWFPGAQSGALWVIGAPGVGADGLTAFSFKEQPEGLVIPLPAAVLSGLTGLSGLMALRRLAVRKHY